MQGGPCSASSRYPSARLPTAHNPPPASHAVGYGALKARRPESDRQGLSPPLTCYVTWGTLINLLFADVSNGMLRTFARYLVQG